MLVQTQLSSLPTTLKVHRHKQEQLKKNKKAAKLFISINNKSKSISKFLYLLQLPLSIFLFFPVLLPFSRPTHPEEKVQGLAAVETTAEGDEDSCVGRPHSRPGWAGPPERVLYFHQAPGPDPAHYHQDSCGANAAWVGGPQGGRGEGGRRRGVRKGGREGVSQSRQGRGEGEKTETVTQTGERTRERRQAGEKW